MNLFQRIKKKISAKRMEEADLNRESANAATYYVRKACKGMPLVEEQNALNFVAHGFSMGVRWKEEQIGVNRVD
jgi:hypothetical protein